MGQLRADTDMSQPGADTDIRLSGADTDMSQLVVADTDESAGTQL